MNLFYFSYFYPTFSSYFFGMLPLFDSDDIDLPIEKIIIGPHKDKETRAAILRKRLRKTKIEITCSDIPYVE